MVMKGSVNTELTDLVLSLRLVIAKITDLVPVMKAQVIAKITDLEPSTEAGTLAEITDSMPVYVVCN